MRDHEFDDSSPIIIMPEESVGDAAPRRPSAVGRLLPLLGLLVCVGLVTALAWVMLDPTIGAPPLAAPEEASPQVSGQTDQPSGGLAASLTPSAHPASPTPRQTPTARTTAIPSPTPTLAAEPSPALTAPASPRASPTARSAEPTAKPAPSAEPPPSAEPTVKPAPSAEPTQSAEQTAKPAPAETPGPDGLVSLARITFDNPGVTMSLFDAKGATAESLLDSIGDGAVRRCGYIDYSWYGRAKPEACAKSSVTWTMRIIGSVCRITSVTIAYTIYMPVWVAPARVAKPLLDWWRKDLALVNRHEMTHVDIYDDHFGELRAAIHGKPCTAARATVNAWYADVEPFQEAWDQQDYNNPDRQPPPSGY